MGSMTAFSNLWTVSESPHEVIKGSFHRRLILATRKSAFSLENVKIKKKPSVY